MNDIVEGYYGSERVAAAASAIAALLFSGIGLWSASRDAPFLTGLGWAVSAVAGAAAAIGCQYFYRLATRRALAIQRLIVDEHSFLARESDDIIGTIERFDLAIKCELLALCSGVLTAALGHVLDRAAVVGVGAGLGITSALLACCDGVLRRRAAKYLKAMKGLP